MSDRGGDRMQAARRGASESLCAQPSDTPRAFHFFVGQSSSGVGADVYQEIVAAAWTSRRRVTSFAAASFAGDVLGRMRAAAVGGLRGADELEPVRRHPLLWEIKWKTGSARDHRLYHSEPGGSPDMVALRFHRKDVSSGDAATIEAAQEVEMDEAGWRHGDGVKNQWGHSTSCAHCLVS